MSNKNKQEKIDKIDEKQTRADEFCIDLLYMVELWTGEDMTNAIITGYHRERL